MIIRTMQALLQQAAEQYAVITLIGARQTGKTTLAQMAFPEKAYISLEDLDVRLLAQSDPRKFLSQFPQGAILDEIQHVPELLSYIQTQVDQDNRKGLFVLIGSNQLNLQAHLAQSLAGRTLPLNLLPLTLEELKSVDHVLPLNRQILTGFYPRIYQDHLTPTLNYRAYLQTYVERDLRQLIALKDLSVFQRFLKLCAGRIGEILNKNNLSNELGVSSSTIEQWLSVLEASSLIIRLQPYFENLGKRLIKSPKLYFTDVGLACYLLDIQTDSQLDRDPKRGALIENLVFLELIKYQYNRGYDAQLYFYRDSQMHEVDFIFKQGVELIPIEVKAAETLHLGFFKQLKYLQKLVGTRCPYGFLIYAGQAQPGIGSFSVLNYQESIKIFE